MMSTIDRRAVLTGAAAAIPAVAIAAVPALASPDDAELIALGKEIEAFLRRYIPALIDGYHKGWGAWAVAAERAGVADLPEGTRRTDEQTNRLFEEMRVASRENGYDANERLMEPMWKEVDRLMDAVNALPAKTEAGLRAKLLNAVMTNAPLVWHDDADMGEREMRKLLIATCTVLGIALPEGDIEDVS